MENKKSYYAIIPANVRYDERLKLLSRMLYGEITALSNEKGYCWATNAYFASLYNTSLRTIKSCISELKEYGYINVKLIYKENSKEVEKRILTIAENFTTYGKNFHHPSEENFTTPGEKNCTDNNTSINNTINNNNKEIKSHLSIPDLEEIRNYVKEKNLNVVPEDFFNYYTKCDWVDSRGNKVKSWKQKLLTWNKFSFKNNNATKLIQADEDRYAKLREVTVGNYIPGSLTRDECMKLAFKFDVDNCSFWSSEATKVFNGEYRKG
jgi:hypothetical protein